MNDFRKDDQCPKCKGTGRLPRNGRGGDYTCPECRGLGYDMAPIKAAEVAARKRAAATARVGVKDEVHQPAPFRQTIFNGLDGNQPSPEPTKFDRDYKAAKDAAAAAAGDRLALTPAAESYLDAR